MVEAGKVRFPVGYIRLRAEFESRVSFVSTARELRRNIAYTLQSTDVYRWLLTRTTLTGLAREMVIKQVIGLRVCVMEALLYDALDGVMTRHAKFRHRTARLARDGVISDQLHGELDWAWSTRDGVHLFLVDGAEIGKYTLVDSNRAIRGMQALIKALDAEATKKLSF